MFTPSSVPGFNELAARIPDLRDRHGWLLGLRALASFALATALMLAVDRRWPEWTLVGQLAMIAAGFPLVAPFLWRRRTYLARWGEHAYRKAFLRHVVSGAPFVLAALVHTAYLPGPRLPLGPAAVPALIVGTLAFLFGALLWTRSIWTFGLDNLALVYVYFPAEGRLVDSAVYALIRHPVYSGVLHMILGIGLWRGTWASVAFGLLTPLGLTIWLRLAEERELIERFGERYRGYRRRVPAFWPKPGGWTKLLRFVAMGG
jgi:protein-S-isoprenylcysteine O-methyltransferase Ste14